MKREAVGHTKMKKLCRRLKCDTCRGVGILESLWILTAREAARGDIGRLSNEDIAIGMDYTGDVEELIEALIASEWLDESEEFRLIIHDWSDHADDNTQSKLARARLTFADGKIPKLVKLSKQERDEAQRWYSENVGSGRERTGAEKPLPGSKPGSIPEPVPGSLTAAAPPEPSAPTEPAEPTFVRFKALAIEYGIQVSRQEWGEFEKFTWPKQDWTQKWKCIRGLEERIAVKDRSLVDTTPKNYAERALYERRVRSPDVRQNGPPGNSLEDRARQHRENKQRILEGNP